MRFHISSVFPVIASYKNFFFAQGRRNYLSVFSGIWIDVPFCGKISVDIPIRIRSVMGFNVRSVFSIISFDINIGKNSRTNDQPSKKYKNNFSKHVVELSITFFLMSIIFKNE